MTDCESSFEIFERITKEILTRKRAGDMPTVEEYCDKYPEHDGALRAFLPALLVVEGLKPGSASGDVSSVVGFHSDHSVPSMIGDYRIVRELGRGGMGVVYEAEQQSLGRRVALKVMARSATVDVTAKLRFESEARAAARLHHTNIVPVFDIGASDDYLFYAMQLIRGQSIDLVIDDLRRMRKTEQDAQKTFVDQTQSIAVSMIQGRLHPPLTAESSNDEASFLTLADLDARRLEETKRHEISSSSSGVLPGNSDSSDKQDRQTYYRSVARVGHQAAEALAYAHARGIIHRDIKPSNLLLDGNGIVWITDFGLAKTGEHDLTLSGDLLGTVRYMAPERFRGQCDVRADIYALGITLYELLTLEQAFVAADRLDLIHRISVSDLASPRLRDPSLPRDLETIVLKALDKDPRLRFQSAEELAADLQRFIDDQPIRARRASLAERFVRWSRRNKGLAASLAMIVTLLVLATVVSVIYANRYRVLQENAVRLASRANSERQRANVERDNANAERQRADDSSEEKSRYLYVAHMQMADQAWRTGAISRMRELLNHHLPENAGSDQRGYEWFYLDAACRRAESSKRVDYGEIIAYVVIDPRDQYVFVSGNTGKVSVFSLSDYRLLQELNAGEGKIAHLLVSPDGNTLVTFTWQSFTLWRRTNEAFQSVFQGPASAPFSSRISPDGRFLLVPVDSNSQVDCYDLTVNRIESRQLNMHAAFTDLYWQTDSRRFVVSFVSGRIDQWDAITGEVVQTLVTLEHPVQTMCVSQDGGHLVTASREAVNLIDLSDESHRVRDLGAPAPSLRAVVPLNTTFMVRCHDSLAIWGYDGNLVQQNDLAAGYTPNPSPDGKLFSLTSIDHLVKIYSADTGRELREFKGHSNTVYQVAFAQDGRLVSGGRDRTLRSYSLDQPEDSAKTLRGHEGWLWSVCYAHQGDLIATSSADSNVVLWDAVSGEQVRRLQGHTESVQTTSFSPTERILASGARDHLIKFWDLETKTLVGECRGHNGGVNVVGFSPDGKRLISGGDDGCVYIWDVASRSVIAKHFVADTLIWAGQFVGDSEVVFGGTNGRLMAWRFGDQEAPRELFESKYNITSTQISHDGKTLVCTTGDGAINLIDYASKQVIRRLTGHTADAMHVAFSPNDETLASAGSDGAVIFWSVRTHEPTLRIAAHDTHVQAVEFSPDGGQLATASWDGTLKLWKLHQPPIQSQEDAN